MHMGKGGSVSVKERTAMFEVASVNTGAVAWPVPIFSGMSDGQVDRVVESTRRVLE